MRVFALAVVLVAAKVVAIATGTAFDWSGLLFLWQDALVVAGYAVCDRLARPAVSYLVYLVLVLYTVLNVAVVQVLGVPLSVSMLGAADVALADSIGHYVRVEVLTWAVLILVFSAVAFCGKSRQVTLGHAVVLLLVACSVGAVTGRGTAQRSSNAVVSVVASALPRLGAVHAAPRDWRGTFGAVSRSSPNTLHGRARGRHVVLVVLESVGARYLRPYGAKSDPMPNLSRLARRSLLFENAYAVYPESIKGLVAIQNSTHPALDTRAAEYRHLPTPGLPRVLAERGYRTALFHSGRFEYLGMADVIANAGYQTTVDAAGISGEVESSFGVDESATVAHMLRWLDRRGRRQPVFLTYMPVAGHHPYGSPNGGPFDDTTMFGCYQNAIHAADVALQALIDGLRARRMWDDTLFVVVGDHGQAFGQHPDNFGHTFFLYEENVKVPFLIAAPGLVRRPARIAAVTSHVDVAPTITALLGLAAPSGWEGADALAGSQRLALMFTDYAQALVGLRDGRFKFVHSLESGRSELYDLCRDPGEQRDLSLTRAAQVARYREHVLSWARSRRGAVRGW